MGLKKDPELANSLIQELMFKKEMKKELTVVWFSFIVFGGITIMGIITSISTTKDLAIICLGLNAIFMLGIATQQVEEKYKIIK